MLIHKIRNLLLVTISLTSCDHPKTKYKSFEDYPVTNDNLWSEYSKKATVFKIWSPNAENVQLHLYKKGLGGHPIASYDLHRKMDGVWEVKLEGDLNGTYYTYLVRTKDSSLKETPGIYAQAVGLNGKRAMVLDLKSTNPEGWEEDKGPRVTTPNEAIIYEAHVRGLSIQPESGIHMKGKYLGLAETGTKGPNGIATGLEHIKEMGITHLHLLPTCDFNSIDEAKLDTPRYNWGYDPINYNVPEGSYSTDPYNGAVRIKEFKEMVKALHDNRIGLVLDVVFNHTATYRDSNFNLEVPGYYYRHSEDGTPSNASACGNELASERAMMRKFIVETVSYWAKEYHVDGFRFDLMAILDVKTMNTVSKALKKINQKIIIYGEGWTPGDSPYSRKKRAFKFNIGQMPDVAAFSDEIRDGLRGSVFKETGLGFVNGGDNSEESVKMGVVGCIEHPQIDYNKVNKSQKPWANNPWQSLVYVSCHDNHTLYDKLKVSRPKATEDELIAMDKLANAVVFTSQGIAFIQAGAEFLRTKQGEENSYRSPDSINQIDWRLKIRHPKTVAYYKNLTRLRKEHPAFRMRTGDEVRKNLEFKTCENGLIGYQISNHANGDTWKNIYVIYNARPEVVDYKLPGKWSLAVVGDSFNTNTTTVEGVLKVPARSMLIAFQQ
ncbi:type I pullulanase [Flavobacteriaceae bacterium F89]|uniref:Type I pullulanase n=1 Tax=Cerina litoralis TaxID=2874477 RepID=A0AAE3ESV0_9FLAO|nr:type I pullulanase [Cerina litoralis]MCG2460527.1 type I pullulanase [Cerina litoralis]